MDTLASFTSQCIAKASNHSSIHSFLPPLQSDWSSSSSAETSEGPPELTCLHPPSEEQTKYDLAGEDDVWMCDVCDQLNHGEKSACVLCWRDREDAMAWTVTTSSSEENSSSTDMDDYHSSRLYKMYYSPKDFNIVKVLGPAKTAPRASSPTNGNTSKAFNTPVTGGDMSCSAHQSPKSTKSCESHASPMSYGPAGASPLNDTPSTSFLAIKGPPSRVTKAFCPKLETSFEDDDDDDMLNVPNQIGPFKCSFSGCNSILPDLRALHGHLAQHKYGPHEMVIGVDGLQHFYCRYSGCNRGFNDKKVLRKHMLSHREKVFACHYPDCDRKFYERAKLKRHFLVHTQEKPFICPFEVSPSD
jgi:hypothetical protein